MTRRLGFPTLLLAGALVITPGAAQVIVLERPGVAFFALVGGPNPSPQTIAISNPAAPALTWQITSTAPAWLKVTPPNGAAPATLTFTADVTGLAANIYRTTVVVRSNDKMAPTKNIPVMLTVVALIPTEAAYAVEFKLTGYTGLVDGYPHCAVNPAGTDVLTGIVMGREDVGRAEDVTYRGTLMRLTAIDFCETRGKTGPDDGERVWCAATLIGTSTMKVSIEVYGEAGRGAWVKTEHDRGPFTRSVTGSCYSPDQLLWEKEYPGSDHGGGGGPSGQPIDEAVTGTARLFAAGRARLVVGYFPPSDPKVSSWTLKVIAKIR